jgi:hypothetical protein
MAIVPRDPEQVGACEEGSPNGPRTSLAPPVSGPAEVCNVVRWRGYVTSEFYARRSADGETVATSGTFRWRRAASPPDLGPREAFEALIAVLEASGWEERGRGPLWYERRFERVLLLPAAEIAPAAPAVTTHGIAVVPDMQMLADAPSPPSTAPLRQAQPVAGARATGTTDSEGRVDELGSIEPRPGVTTAPLHRSRRRLVYVLPVCAVLAGIVGGGWLIAGRSRPAHVGPTTEVPVRLAVSHSAAASAASAGAAIVTAPVRLALRGIGTGSWVEVRAGSSRGRIMFSGFVKGGRGLRFEARPRLWVRFGRAADLIIKVNGIRQQLSGTVDAVVTEHGLASP